MAAALDESNVEKKFRGVTQTQESIQSLTLWVIHHKAQHEKIVELWFRVLKKSKMSHRLTMFYLCNEIVQTCKRKHAIIFKDAFKDVLKDAVLLVRDNEVRNAVERIFNIWEERGVYDGEFIEEITAILNNTKVRATINSKLLADFKPKQLIDLVTRMKRHDDDVEIRTRQLSTLRLDASNLEAVKLLKDRMQGKEFCQQFEDSCTKLEKFVGDLEKGIKDRASLIEMLEQSELFYDTQYGEAKIVANAYKNFGSRVNNLRKKLEEHKKLIDNPMSPVPSPSMDAPSPGNTPPHLEDNTQMIDMEMSDEEGRRGSGKNKVVGGSLVPPGMLTAEEFFSQLQSADSPIVMPFQTTTDSGMGQESSLPWTLPPPPPPTTGAPSNSSNLVHLTEGNTTPTADEGSSTPVQDEKPDANMSNPIEFLTQLINQSNKSQTGANASFFDSLTSLTKKVTTEGKDEEVPVTSTETNETPASALDTSLGLAPPAWEPWNPQPETPTPSYVPDTRPTPTMPFGERVPNSQPYTTENLSQNQPFVPDSQGHLYAESQPPSEPYTVDSQPPPQPYIIDPKSAGEQYTLDNQPPPIYGTDTQPPLPPQPFGQGPPPPPPNFMSDQNYIGQGSDHHPIFTSAPPPPPSDPPTSDGAPPPGQFPPSFYQENTHPQAPSPDAPDNMPAFPPPVSSWGQPFSAPGFMPPADSLPTTQDGQAPYLPPPSVSSTSVQPSGGQENATSTFNLLPGAPPPPESPQFSMPPGQPGQEHPPPFSMPTPAPPDQPRYGMPPGQGASEPPPFNMGQLPPEPPPFVMANPPPDPPPFGLHQGAQDNPFNMAPGPGPPHDHHPFNSNPGPGPQSPYNMTPGQHSSDGAFNMPPGNPRDPPPFNLPHGGTGGCDPPPFCTQQDHPPFSGPSRQHGQGPIKSLFDIPPSPQFKRNSPPHFSRRSSGSGPGDGSPFNRGSQSGPIDQHEDYRHRGQHPASHSHDGPPIRGILRHSRHNNLTTIQTQELDSAGSNSDQESIDVSCISTMIGKGRMGPPRPPSQPPTPPTSGPTCPRSQPSNVRDDNDRQEFIEKLKRKKIFPPSIPAAPPKGILKNTSGASNLRSLTEIPDGKSEESIRSLSADSSSEAGETDTKAMSEAKSEEPKLEVAVNVKEDCSQVTDMEVDTEVDSELKNESKPEQIQVRSHHFDHRPNSSEHGDRRRSFDSPRRGDHSFNPFGERRGGHMFHVREPRFGPRRPRFEHNFRDDYGQPFPKRYPSPRFENRFRHQFPRY